MRSVPSDLILDPVPHDFDPTITDDGKVLRWAGTIGGRRYVIGLRPRRSPADLQRARDDLRTGVWQLNEFERLGRRDLMAYAHVDRHKNRPGPPSQIT